MSEGELRGPPREEQGREERGREGSEHVRKGAALLKRGRRQEALEAYDLGLRVLPYNADAWGGKGDALLSLGRYRASLGAYERALAIDPDNVLARSNKDLALRALGRPTPQGTEGRSTTHGGILDNVFHYADAVDAYERALWCRAKRGFASFWGNDTSTETNPHTRKQAP